MISIAIAVFVAIIAAAALSYFVYCRKTNEDASSSRRSDSVDAEASVDVKKLMKMQT